MIVRYLVLTMVLSFAASIASAHLHAVAEQQAEGASTQQAGDAKRGKLVFERRCTGCHALDENREGPQLRTVYGRKAGSVAGFEYSEALTHSGLTWTPATLEQWLTDPDAMVPGNNMSFATPKAADRRDLIAYLQTVGSK
jgi:cytochrome c